MAQQSLQKVKFPCPWLQDLLCVSELKHWYGQVCSVEQSEQDDKVEEESWLQIKAHLSVKQGN